MKILEGKSILVVDDEPMLREAFAQMFVLSGARVKTAENGVVAFQLIKAETFDAVLTDVRMPGGDGIELIKNIGQHITVKPKLFVCSGYNDLTEQNLAELGIIAFFDKPFDRKQMLETIAAAL